jgi:hypothetical protein
MSTPTTENLGGGVTVTAADRGIILRSTIAGYINLIPLDIVAIKRLDDFILRNGLLQELPHPKPNE